MSDGSFVTGVFLGAFLAGAVCGSALTYYALLGAGLRY